MKGRNHSLREKSSKCSTRLAKVSSPGLLHSPYARVIQKSLNVQENAGSLRDTQLHEQAQDVILRGNKEVWKHRTTKENGKNNNNNVRMHLIFVSTERGMRVKHLHNPLRSAPRKYPLPVQDIVEPSSIVCSTRACIKCWGWHRETSTHHLCRAANIIIAQPRRKYRRKKWWYYPG